MSDCTPSCGHWAEIEELKRLRQLITEWADSLDFGVDSRSHLPKIKALREAVGR